MINWSLLYSVLHIGFFFRCLSETDLWCMLYLPAFVGINKGGIFYHLFRCTFFTKEKIADRLGISVHGAWGLVSFPSFLSPMPATKARWRISDTDTWSSCEDGASASYIMITFASAWLSFRLSIHKTSVVDVYNTGTPGLQYHIHAPGMQKIRLYCWKQEPVKKMYY